MTSVASSPQDLKGTSFASRLRMAVQDRQSLLCVGLDPLPERLPRGVGHGATGATTFCEAVIDATYAFAAAYKLNLGFFLSFGRESLDALARVREAIPAEIPVILDCKVGDIDSTSAAYARAWFEEFEFDAITVHPYLGEDSLAPFFQYEDRGVFVLCKTSNAGGGDFQDLLVHSAGRDDTTLAETVARRSAEWQERYPATVGLVVGATYPDQLAAVRGLCPAQPILLPGVGAQGGDLEAAVRAGIDRNGEHLLVSASRSIIYASTGADFAEAARSVAQTTRDAINRARESVVTGATS